jgi:hypothetical protein
LTAKISIKIGKESAILIILFIFAAYLLSDVKYDIPDKEKPLDAGHNNDPMQFYGSGSMFR